MERTCKIEQSVLLYYCFAALYDLLVNLKFIDLFDETFHMPNRHFSVSFGFPYCLNKLMPSRMKETFIVYWKIVLIRV